MLSISEDIPTDGRRKTPAIPGRPVRISEDKEREILGHFDTDLLHSWQGKQPRVELALKAVKAYKAHIEGNDKSIFFTQLYIPVVFSAIETAVAAEWKNLFSYPLLEFSPRDPSSQVDCEKASYYNDCFDFHWNKRQAILPVTELLRQRRLYGGAFFSMFWKEEVREVAAWGQSEVRTYESMGTDESGKPIFREYVDTARTLVPRKVKTVDSPWWEVIHFLEAFPDWESRPDEFQSSRYFIHIKPRSKDYLERRFKSGVWKHKKYKEILESKGFTDGFGAVGANSTDSVKNWQVILGQTYDSNNDTSQGGLHEVAEYYRPEGVYTIIDRQWVVLSRRGYPMGRIPVGYIPNYPDPAGGFWGISDFELIRSCNNHVQNMANASGTDAIFGVFPMLVGDHTLDKTQLRVRPGHVIQEKTPGSTRFLTRPSNGIQIAESQKASSLQTIDDTLGTSEVVRGSLPTRDTSATAVAQSVNSSGRRMELNSDIIGERFIQVIGEGYRDMINLMQSEPVSAQMRESSKCRVISPEDLQDPDLDCRPVANMANIRELEKKQLMEFMVTVGNLQGAMTSVDLNALGRIYAQLSIPKFSAEVVRTPEEAETMRQAMQAEAMAQGQAQGPSGTSPVSNQTFNNMEGDHAAATRDQASAMSL